MIQPGETTSEETETIEIIATPEDPAAELAAAFGERQAMPQLLARMDGADRAYLAELGRLSDMRFAGLLLRVVAAGLILVGFVLLFFQLIQTLIGKPFVFRYTLTENGMSRDVPFSPVWGNILLAGIILMIWGVAFVLTRMATALSIVPRVVEILRKL